MDGSRPIFPIEKVDQVQLDIYDYLSFVVLGLLTTVFVTFIVVLGFSYRQDSGEKESSAAAAINAASWIACRRSCSLAYRVCLGIYRFRAYVAKH